MDVGDFTVAGVTIKTVVAVLLLVDIYLYRGKKQTLSQKLYTWGNISMAIPMFAGILIGHWFW